MVYVFILMQFFLSFFLCLIFPFLIQKHIYFPFQKYLLLLFSHQFVSDSSQPYGLLQHARLPCSSSSPEVCPSSCPLDWWCHPCISPFASLLLLPSSFPSIRVFSYELPLHISWPKYWSFSFRISPCNEYLGLISFRFDWLDLLAVQGTLRSLLRHHSLKASTLQCSAIFLVQLSHPYMTTGKTIALSIQTFVGKEISLPFNTLSRFVIAFLPIKQPIKPLDVYSCGAREDSWEFLGQ